RIPVCRTSSPFPYTTLFRSSVSVRFGIGFIAPFGRSLSRRYMLSGDVNTWRSIVIGRIARNTMKATTWLIHIHWCHVPIADSDRSEEHTSELQSRENLVCRL